MLRLEIATGPKSFDALKAQWQTLLDESPTATPFQSWEWHRTWWTHYGGLKQPLFLQCYDDSRLVGLYPCVVVTAAGYRALRPMGIGPSDYLHPLAAAGFERPVAATLLSWIQSQNRASLIDLHQIRDSLAFGEACSLAFPTAQQNIDQATTLVLDLPESWEAYLAMLGKSLRYDVKKLEKKAFIESGATFTWATPDTVETAFGAFLHLHETRWKKRGLPGAFFGRGKKFQFDWIRLAAEKGWLWLSLLKIQEKVVGSVYAMTLGNTVYFYQSGFDPEAATISPGTLLVATTIRRSIEEGKTHFDFMRGDEPYKRRWKPQQEFHNRRFLSQKSSPSFRSSLSGRFGEAWNGATWRVECSIRAKVEGKSLRG